MVEDLDLSLSAHSTFCSMHTRSYVQQHCTRFCTHTRHFFSILTFHARAFATHLSGHMRSDRTTFQPLRSSPRTLCTRFHHTRRALFAHTFLPPCTHTLSGMNYTCTACTFTHALFALCTTHRLHAHFHTHMHAHTHTHLNFSDRWRTEHLPSTHHTCTRHALPCTCCHYLASSSLSTLSHTPSLSLLPQTFLLLLSSTFSLPSFSISMPFLAPFCHALSLHAWRACTHMPPFSA